MILEARGLASGVISQLDEGASWPQQRMVLINGELSSLCWVSRWT
jgi:hypothetical protein